MAKLVVLSEGLTGRTYELKTEKTTVGRVEDNAFQIAEPSVSSHHCELLLRGEDVWVKDLGSTNGTFINGDKVAEGPVKPGQILRLGSVEMRLEGAGQPASKKVLDHTVVIPQGVKLDEVGQAGNTVTFEKGSPFAKKTNKVNRIFIGVGVLLGLVIVIAIVYAGLKILKVL